MTKKERDQLTAIEFNFLTGVSDNKQCKKLGLSKQGFYQRIWSLRKKQLIEEWDGNFSE